MQKLDSQTVQLIIVAAVAVTMLMQSIVLLAILGALRKAAQAMRQDVEELRTTVVPVIENFREFLVHTGPKIEAAAVDIAAMSHNLRRQTADVQVAANGILDRLNKQLIQLAGRCATGGVPGPGRRLVGLVPKRMACAARGTWQQR